MAVPSSGTLNISALAAEKLENDYTDVDTSYRPYSLKDITLGGATTVNGEDYDVTNNNSANKPDIVAPHAMSEWYGYDHDASGSTGKCLLVIDSTFLTPGTQTGCSSATAIAGATGAIMTGATNSLDYISRFGRYRNNSTGSVTYNIRVYRQYSDHCELKIYKGTQTSTTGYTLINQTLVHTHTSTGYQTFTGTLNSGSDLTIYFGSTPNANATRYASFDQFYVNGSCSYNGTMYAVPILGSGSSTAYQWSSASSAWSNGYSQRYNSSSWSTAYIHQCAGSAWTIGNTIYQTNSSAGTEVAFSGTGWRCGAYPTSEFSFYGAPGGNNYNIIAFYNAFHATGNIENTFVDEFL
jgi:hypothetical protein